tara:strand:- start:217 stop:543 length:327 start_codon:yes stop_codon:yes gene_type:complete
MKNYETKPHIGEAIRELVGGATSGSTDSFESTVYHDGQTPPTKAEAESKLASMISEWESQEYARNRATAFPSIGDQLDMLFHDMTADKGSKTGEWYKAIAKVKADNPK